MQRRNLLQVDSINKYKLIFIDEHYNTPRFSHHPIGCSNRVSGKILSCSEDTFELAARHPSGNRNVYCRCYVRKNQGNICEPT